MGTPPPQANRCAGANAAGPGVFGPDQRGHRGHPIKPPPHPTPPPPPDSHPSPHIPIHVLLPLLVDAILHVFRVQTLPHGFRAQASSTLSPCVLGRDIPRTRANPPRPPNPHPPPMNCMSSQHLSTASASQLRPGRGGSRGVTSKMVSRANLRKKSEQN